MKGCGAVYVVDGATVTHCNLAEAEPDRVLAMHNMTVHVLGTGDGYNLGQRTPLPQGLIYSNFSQLRGTIAARRR